MFDRLGERKVLCVVLIRPEIVGSIEPLIPEELGRHEATQLYLPRRLRLQLFELFGLQDDRLIAVERVSLPALVLRNRLAIRLPDDPLLDWYLVLCVQQTEMD